MTHDALLTLDEIFETDDGTDVESEASTTSSALEDFHTFFRDDTADPEDPVGDGEIEESVMADVSRIPADSSLSLYFQQMSKVPLLSRDEEIALAKRIERGREAQEALAEGDPPPEKIEEWEAQIRDGQAAREHLAEANTRLVISVAKKYRGYIPFLDLIQAGNVGLLKAIDKFDYQRGYKFSTYATWWIRQAVSRSLLNHKRTIRIPIHMNDQIRTINRIRRQLEQKLDRRPSPEEIAEEMGEEPQKVRKIIRHSWMSTSLNKPVGHDREEGDAELGNFIEDRETPSPPETTETNMLQEKLSEVIDGLNTREAWILRRRFGLHGHRQHTLKELGRKLGISKERVRQIEGRALRRLRHPMQHLQDYR
jgi:RNA polymerase primary sigma factor